MFTGRLIFNQVMDFMPLTVFRRCVAKYQGDFKVRSFSCFDQYLCMAFAQITYRESLRDIEACLRSQSNKLYHMGIRSKARRSTLADANELRDWRIYAELAHALIAGVSDEQFYPAGTDDRPTVPLPLAGGAVFQVDQTKPQNQMLLRDIRKRGEDPGMDSGLSVRSRGNHEKTAPPPRESLHNSTDFKCQCI